MKRTTTTAFFILACTLGSSVQADSMLRWKEQADSVVSALKIVTKQKQVSTDKAVSVRGQAMQAYASSNVDVSNREAILDTVDQYGRTGQLVDPCYQVSMASVVQGAMSKTDASAQAAMQRLYRTSDDGEMNSGGLTGALGATTKVSAHPYAAPTAQRIERRFSRYCSVSEASAGYCKLNSNGMQSGDSDFSLHVAPGKTFGWDQTEAATDFVKTIAPVKPMPKTGKCTNPECIAATNERRQQEVYMSMSRYSMVRFVESRSTQASGEAKKAGGGG